MNWPRKDAKLVLQIILGVAISAALIDLLYERLLITPIIPRVPRFSMGNGLALASIGAFAVGCVSSFWEHKFLSLFLSAILGIISGATWPVIENLSYWTKLWSDVYIPWWFPFQIAIPQLWQYHIVVLVAVVSGWCASHLFFSKWFRSLPQFCSHKVRREY